uniref:NADH-plastoquinone oxidoreductase subunit 7 n=1 Tax=Gentiana haynaldii TaxID=50764 RepID=A0A8B0R7H1_9GENT|nr:NADH-plastoquinone oxidoreductase subunit 7 [Gentiana haynaldii]QTW90814.1 NADH-plastoquinone oxidoreductase subunit 7 [Gentiana haynaldii]
MEKIAENRKILQDLPYVTRWDYLATIFKEAIMVKGLQQLRNIQVPKRYIRVIILELSHLASHLLGLGPLMANIGTQIPFLHNYSYIIIFEESLRIYLLVRDR